VAERGGEIKKRKEKREKKALSPSSGYCIRASLSTLQKKEEKKQIGKPSATFREEPTLACGKLERPGRKGKQRGRAEKRKRRSHA